MSKVTQQNIAVVSQTPQLKFSDLQGMCAAHQKQLANDYFPIWKRPTNVIAVKSKSAIPHGFWPAYVRDDIGEPGAAGYHTNENNQPVIYIQFDGDNTSLTLSHEGLETASDSQGNKLIKVTLPKVGPVMMLCEIGDPCEEKFYMVDGFKMSDFLRPAWYGYDDQDPPGSKLTFLNTIKTPCSLIRGGYFSYLTPDGTWWQQTWFSGSRPKTVNLGKDEGRKPDQSLREWIDQITSKRK